MTTFIHSGHCGDLIAALPTIRAMGGGHIVVTNHELAPHNWRPMKGEWRGIPSPYECLKPLLEAQPYILGVSWSDNPVVDRNTVDLRNFRECYRPDKSLVAAHADFARCQNVDTSKWLWATPHAGILNRPVVVSRTARHHGHPNFPWKDIVSAISGRGIFVGTRGEWTTFTSTFGHIDWYPTADFLQVAMVLSAASSFVGNQSANCWLAVGLGMPVFQETMVEAPDSVVLRGNSVWCQDGCLDTRLILATLLQP